MILLFINLSKKALCLILLITSTLLICPSQGYSQRKKKKESASPASITAKDSAGIKTLPKAFAEVIPDKAFRDSGLLNVYKTADKYYFEIPDSIFGRDLLAVTRIAKTATGIGYGGEETNRQLLQFEKGPDYKVFIRQLSLINRSSDTSEIARAVANSNVPPIIAAFDIKAFSKDSNGVVIDVTDYFKSDNAYFSIGAAQKKLAGLSGIQADRSYIASIKSFPINVEIRSVKTFSKGTPLGAPSSMISTGPDVATFEINNSLLLLPKVPMQPRIADNRVGFFSTTFNQYSNNSQRVEHETYIVRWRLEPKPEDMEKYKRGELVEPQKPIVYYIDPSTPKKWRKYLIQGVLDWNKAFEQAGFKHAITAREWPENDSTMSLEDARYSVIRYFASPVENAYGPNVNDPRSGEIIESHIGWYHNVMNLLRNWYLIQTAAVNPAARKIKFDDEVMGELVRFVSSHEVGHTLGLRHNMGASSAYPVEKLRDKNWVKKYGHAPSIMDYARFNYVAQPEDSITGSDLYPRIGTYDRWAIEWGYKLIPEAHSAQAEKPTLNKWILSHANDPMYWFGKEGNPLDPRAQTEDLGDNAMKASEYGIRNLKRILPHLLEWSRQSGEEYENLEELYNNVVLQVRRYFGHVAANVGGIYQTPKTYDQEGVVFTPVPKELQKDAVAFLNQYAFQTPQWLLDYNVLKRFNGTNVTEDIRTMQESVLNNLLGTARLQRILESSAQLGEQAYGADDLLSDLQNGIWSELKTGKAIDPFRRNLQKSYVEKLIGMIKTDAATTISSTTPGLTISLGPSFDINKSDIPSVIKAQLMTLRSRIKTALPQTRDQMSKYHLMDVADRITRALEPK